MDKEALLEGMKAQAKNTAPIGGTIKFVVDDDVVYLDGTGAENVISHEDKDADTVISASSETLDKLQSGKLNPMMAAMTGKLKIKGDMGLAMKIQSLLS
ncbi:MAG: SCP2 sterol-binding domain-containing protein [Bacteroidota bacterium]